MTIAEMKHHFTHRELGIQGAVGEYAILVPLAQWEGKLCLLFETRAETLVGHQPGEVCFPGGRRERGERPVETALRETWEEIGIPWWSSCISATGWCTPFWAPSAPRGWTGLRPARQR